MLPLEGKRVLITGGTGSLGKVLLRRLMTGEMGQPQKIIVFSRDEAKQHALRLEYKNKQAATDEVIYHYTEERLEFRIGDVRDYASVASALRDADVVFNAAALKQVPTCEYFPFQAVLTNTVGAENIVRAIEELCLPIEVVVGVSTDKACKAVNVMGMTKAIQERIFIQGNLRCPRSRFICVRYGNVLASRGSVIPLFYDQIRTGGPVTITTREMTRFLLSLDQAVDTIFAAVTGARRGETYIPRVASAKVVDIAAVLIRDRPIQLLVTGVRPGEKVHEILISEEERFRTIERDRWYAIMPILPELRVQMDTTTQLVDEYSSANNVMDRPTLRAFMLQHGLLEDRLLNDGSEVLR